MAKEIFVPKIYTVRNEPVALDSDLALLYGLRPAFLIRRFAEIAIDFRQTLPFH
jgi:hypothetical protein